MDRHDQANLAADQVAATVRGLCDAGLDPLAVLAGAHGAVVTLMATAIGGAAAAGRCAAAADHVRELPPLREVALAAVKPAGRA